MTRRSFLALMLAPFVAKAAPVSIRVPVLPRNLSADDMAAIYAGTARIVERVGLAYLEFNDTARQAMPDDYAGGGYRMPYVSVFLTSDGTKVPTPQFIETRAFTGFVSHDGSPVLGMIAIRYRSVKLERVA